MTTQATVGGTEPAVWPLKIGEIVMTDVNSEMMQYNLSSPS